MVNLTPPRSGGVPRAQRAAGRSGWRSDSRTTPSARRVRAALTPLHFVEGRRTARPSRSMALAGDDRAALADQEVEVGAAVGLQHMVGVELVVAAVAVRLRRLPRRLAVRQLGVGDV